MKRVTWEDFRPLAEAVLADIGLPAALDTGAVQALAKRLFEIRQTPLARLESGFVKLHDEKRALIARIRDMTYSNITDGGVDNCRRWTNEVGVLRDACLEVMHAVNTLPAGLAKE